ncbi:hypothetical protein OG21DRAFT_1505692 [Imleria badia]|nr:hypothetical protein OG21DRAFT_1505692 [Imleria badia]
MVCATCYDIHSAPGSLASLARHLFGHGCLHSIILHRVRRHPDHGGPSLLPDPAETKVHSFVLKFRSPLAAFGEAATYSLTNRLLPAFQHFHQAPLRIRVLNRALGLIIALKSSTTATFLSSAIPCTRHLAERMGQPACWFVEKLERCIFSGNEDRYEAPLQMEKEHHHYSFTLYPEAGHSIHLSRLNLSTCLMSGRASHTTRNVLRR